MNIFISGNGHTIHFGGTEHVIRPDKIGDACMLSGEFFLKDDTEKEGEIIEVISPRHRHKFIYKFVSF